MGQVGDRRFALALVFVFAQLAAGCARYGFGPASLAADTGSGSGSGQVDGADGSSGDGDLPATPGWVAARGTVFVAGSPPDEPCRASDESLVNIELSAFEIMPTEVTQDQFEQRMGYNPAANAGCSDCPVERVSWHEAAAYCNRLSTESGLQACYSCSGAQAQTRCSSSDIAACLGYRLPSEAEWELAARAGTTTALYNGPISVCQGQDAGAQAIGWHHPEANARTHPVGTKAPNAWGIHDTSGNVWEWVHDWYESSRPAASAASPLRDPFGPASGSERGIRGGSFINAPHNLRSGNREHGDPDRGSIYYGFRCARRLP